MARKFKAGDRVKVARKFGQLALLCKIGHTGKVMEINSFEYGHIVKLRNRNHLDNFNAQELEKIN